MSDRNDGIVTFLGAAIVAGALVLPGSAEAQSGKIVCWKDKSGKVIGCGDKVPPEFQSSATKELDSRGVTRRQTESTEEVNRRREKEQEFAKTKVEDDRKALDQKRQDTALIETYASEKEIDAKRDRDLQVLDLQIEQLEGAVKNATHRYNDVKGRADSLEKNKKPLPAQLKDELSRVTAEKARFEQSIVNKNKEKEELRIRYAEHRKRFTELRSQQTAAKK
jgi:hypothetical protein